MTSKTKEILGIIVAIVLFVGIGIVCSATASATTENKANDSIETIVDSIATDSITVIETVIDSTCIDSATTSIALAD